MQRLEFRGAVLPIYGSVGVKRLTRMESMYLSNTTSFVGRGMQIIYYIRYNYMFRRLTMAIFKVYVKYLVSSYTKFIMCSGCGRCGGHEISYVFAGLEVWVHLPTSITHTRSRAQLTSYPHYIQHIINLV